MVQLYAGGGVTSKSRLTAHIPNSEGQVLVLHSFLAHATRSVKTKATQHLLSDPGKFEAKYVDKTKGLLVS